MLGSSLAWFGFQGSVHFLLRQQGVPLGHRAPRIGQHVRPVAQADACSAVTHEGPADGVVASELVVVKHRDDHLHFLQVKTE